MTESPQKEPHLIGMESGEAVRSSIAALSKIKPFWSYIDLDSDGISGCDAGEDK